MSAIPRKVARVPLLLARVPLLLSEKEHEQQGTFRILEFELGWEIAVAVHSASVIGVPRSGEDEVSPVDGECLTGDEPGHVTAQKEHHWRHVAIGVAKFASERDRLGKVTVHR